MVASRLRASGLMGNIISVYVRQTENDSVGQSKRLGYYLTDGRDIFLESKKLLEKCGAENLRVKLVGVTVAGLTNFANQKSLFPTEEKRKQALKALDKINGKYGDFTISRVPSHLARHIIRDSVGFGRMKEFTQAPIFKRGKI
jgi:DNA polymerase-4